MEHTQMLKEHFTEEIKLKFLLLLKTRFQQNIMRHPHLTWKDVESQLTIKEEKLWSLYLMEETGGEPDVVEFPNSENQIIFCDCVTETPKGRRSLCYDEIALASRKEHKPKDSVISFADKMGIELLTEQEYRWLQGFAPMDQKTSSWIKTPTEIRSLGGALFGDYRYGQVFIYHNGADSYYSHRGFRGKLVV